MSTKLKPTIVQDGQFFIIKKAPGSRPPSEGYEKLMRRIEKRIQKCAATYPMIQKYLWSFPEMSKGRLLQLAERIAAMLNITVDRVAKRTKEPLICWYCEHWNYISNIVQPVYQQLLTESSFHAFHSCALPSQLYINEVELTDSDFEVFTPIE